MNKCLLIGTTQPKPLLRALYPMLAHPVGLRRKGHVKRNLFRKTRWVLSRLKACARENGGRGKALGTRASRPQAG